MYVNNTLDGPPVNSLAFVILLQVVYTKWSASPSHWVTLDPDWLCNKLFKAVYLSGCSQLSKLNADEQGFVAMEDIKGLLSCQWQMTNKEDKSSWLFVLFTLKCLPSLVSLYAVVEQHILFRHGSRCHQLMSSVGCCECWISIDLKYHRW